MKQHQWKFKSLILEFEKKFRHLFNDQKKGLAKVEVWLDEVVWKIAKNYIKQTMKFIAEEQEKEKKHDLLFKKELEQFNEFYKEFKSNLT